MGTPGVSHAVRRRRLAELGPDEEVRIGDAAVIAGVSESVLRRFEGLSNPPVRPVRRVKPRGDRYYRVRDLRAYRKAQEAEASA